MTDREITRAAASTALSSTRVLRVDAAQERRQLFVYLHGYGSRAEDLLPIATALAASFPQAESLLPDGFAASPTGGMQWWSVEGMTDENRPQRIDAARSRFERWLDGERGSRSLLDEDVVLIGFSQGAALAVTTGSHRPLMAVVSFCGRPTEVTDAASTPILLVQGSQDPFISVGEATEFEAALRARGADVELRLVADLGHRIDRTALDAARDFLASR